MTNAPVVVTLQSIRGTDTNSLLRLYDRAKGVRTESLSQADRARADKTLERIGCELHKRNIRV